jgi:hypothetical protein
MAPPMSADIKFFGRYKGGAIRDGVLMAVDTAPGWAAWSCDSDEAVGAFDAQP